MEIELAPLEQFPRGQREQRDLKDRKRPARGNPQRQDSEKEDRSQTAILA